MQWSERGTKLVAFSIAIVLVATLTVVLRFISRGYLHGVLGLTDWFILLTLVVAVGNTVTIVCHVTNGLGRHMVELSTEQKIAMQKTAYAAILVGNFSIILPKLSILLLFLDVFVLPSMRRITRFMMAIVITYGIYLVISSTFFCRPISGFWNPQVPGRKCLNGRVKWFVENGMNITLDFTIFCLPIPFLNYLKLPWKQKVWLHFVFALGFLVCVVSLIRLYFLSLSVKNPDKSYCTVPVAYWSTIEMNVAIIVACVPTYKPLLNRFCPCLLASSPSDSEELHGMYGVLCGRSHPPTISSGPSRQLPNPEAELQHV